MNKLRLCTTAQAGAVQEFSYVGQNFLVLKWKEVLISKYGIGIEHIEQKELLRRIRVSGLFMYIKGQHIILQSPRVLEQHNSTYISTYIVFQYRLYTGGPYISFH